MFLRLTPIVAAGRALAAFAVTTASMSGHASVGHMHADFSRAALGFLILLAFAWGSNRRSTLLLGAILAQLVVHGSTNFTNAHMLALHIGAALLAGALTWHFEALWVACTHALAPLLQLPRTLGIDTPALPRQRHRTVWRNRLHAARFVSSLPGRGPPVFA